MANIRIVYCRPNVLRTLHHLPAANDGYHSKGWPNIFPGLDYCMLGGYHDCKGFPVSQHQDSGLLTGTGNGIRPGLGCVGWNACAFGCAGSWLLPWLRLLAIVLVYSM